MNKFIFSALYKFTSILSRLIAKIRAPWIKKAIEYADVDLIQKCHLEMGDFIVTKTNGELSTLLIPGFYAHLAINVGDGYIIDATPAGVQMRYLADLCMKADNVAIIRPKWDTINADIEINRLVAFCYEQLGKKYDYSFNLQSSEAFFCSELGMKALNYAKRKEFIEARETWGIPTFTPQDCYLATKKFDIIWEKRHK